jgi:hypothetical protein
MSVKSDCPNSPGRCTCGKNTSFGGPHCARHSCTRRCRVRSCPGVNRPGYLWASAAQIVFASSPPSSFSHSSICGQTSAYGFGRVRHVRGGFVSDGISPERAYLRAVGSLIPARTAARIRGLPSCNSFISRLTCWSVITLAPGYPGDEPKQDRRKGSDPKILIVAAARPASPASLLGVNYDRRKTTTTRKF